MAIFSIVIYVLLPGQEADTATCESQDLLTVPCVSMLGSPKVREFREHLVLLMSSNLRALDMRLHIALFDSYLTAIRVHKLVYRDMNRHYAY